MPNIHIFTEEFSEVNDTFTEILLKYEHKILALFRPKLMIKYKEKWYQVIFHVQPHEGCNANMDDFMRFGYVLRDTKLPVITSDNIRYQGRVYTKEKFDAYLDSLIK